MDQAGHGPAFFVEGLHHALEGPADRIVSADRSRTDGTLRPGATGAEQISELCASRHSLQRQSALQRGADGWNAGRSAEA